MGEVESTQKKARRTEAPDLLEFHGVPILLLAQQLNGACAQLPTQPIELDKLATVITKCERGLNLLQIRAGKTIMGQIAERRFGYDAQPAAYMLRLLAAAGSSKDVLASAKAQLMQIINADIAN